MKKSILVLLALVMVFNLVSCGQSNTVEVVKCLYCGEKNPAAAKFCNACGKPFSIGEQPSEDNPSTLPESDTYVMQNSGAKRVYYGNNVCVDGEIIYVGYYGTLYVFCGNEVTTYAGGGTKSTTLSALYLYNGFVYYANLDNHCIYRINVADGNREAVVTDVTGEIVETCMRQNILYIRCNDNGYLRIYALNLDTRENKPLHQGGTWIDGPDENNCIFVSKSEGNKLSFLKINGVDGTVKTVHSLTPPGSIFGVYQSKKGETSYYIKVYSRNQEVENSNFSHYTVHKQTLAFSECTYDDFRAAQDVSGEDDLQWRYTVNGSVIRRHKTSDIVETLVKSGTGMTGEGEAVAKDYKNNKLLYADDTRVIFSRSRMNHGIESSVWVIDSDGNHLRELVRKEYSNDVVAFPNGSPSNTQSGTSGGGSLGENGDAVGTKTCALCGGDGRVTCYYCKGSGKGQTIYVMGIPTEQGCSYCGSSGWRVCSGCGGHGVK